MNKEEVEREFLSVWKFGHPEFFKVIWKMCEIHELKNKGYGLGDPLGNFKESERFNIPAWKGCLVRLSDKVTRIYNLTSKYDNPEYKDAISLESLEDTLLDLANYAILCLILLKESER